MPRRLFALAGSCLVVACFVVGCGSKANEHSAPTPNASAVASAAPSGAPSAAASAAPRVFAKTPREGSVIVRSPDGAHLYVADEDHGVLRVVPVPLDASKPRVEVKLPGAPAQIVAVADRVFVTVRDPGMLVAFDVAADGGLKERGRVELASDAWGLTLTPDEATALVTSAWTHTLSAVDLATLKPRWTVDVAREPRGVVVTADGARAYVTHLIGSPVTRVEGLGASPSAGGPTLKRVDVPPSPIRAPSGRTLDASLGYAAAIAPDGATIFFARHALGALGKDAWFGAATVDAVTLADEQLVAPPHFAKLPFQRIDNGNSGEDFKLPGGSLTPFTQPRALVYRKKTDTLLVVGQGDDRVVELDAISADPTLAVVRTLSTTTGYDGAFHVAKQGAAPEGIALSADESTAWVFCRATYDVVELALDAPPEAPPTPTIVRVADDALDETAALGRRLFYNATDKITSGGVACAGCHPDGRDDGHVWHEAKINTAEGVAVNFLGDADQAPEEDHVKGAARRTPILAGRVAAQGPYGWHAESPTLEARLEGGFGLHRWATIPKHDPGNLAARAGALAAFLRKGLVPPPRPTRPLTPEEERGKVVFTSAETLCKNCHVPDTAYTDRSVYPMKFPQRVGFDEEENIQFKVPSLAFVGGHGTMFHDGSAATLEALIDNNADRMGKTNQLSKDDRAALVAFLRTL